MNYLTIKDVAQKWSISERRLRQMCIDGLIEGAVKKEGIWLIPDNINKPSDRRYKNRKHIVVVTSSLESGELIAKHFIMQGYNVSIISEEKSQISDVMSYVCLKNDNDNLKSILNSFDRIDSLIVFPSSYLPKKIDEVTSEEFDYYADLIVKQTYNCIKYSIETIRTSKGNIVLLHSSVALNVEPGALIYSMLQSTLVMLGKALAIREAQYGVRVNNIALGPATTDKLKEQVNREQFKEWKSINPLGVSFNFKDCLDILSFLTIENRASKKMTGTVIPIDGGESIADAYTITQKGGK